MMDIRTVEFDFLHGHALMQNELQDGKFRRDGGDLYDPRGVQVIVGDEHGILDDNDIGKNIRHIPDIKPIADKRIGGIGDLGFI